MRAVFTSVTRLFRRRSSFLTAALSHPSSSPTSSSSSSPSSSPTRTTSRNKAKNNNKSRHELVSEAHIAYMQQQASMFSSSSSLSLPLSPTWTESSSIIGRCGEEEGEGEEVSSSSSSSSSSPAFESLCHGLRRAEASMSQYLSTSAPSPSSSRSGTGTGEPTHSYYR